LKFFKKAMKRYGSPHIVVMDKCRSDDEAMKEIGNLHRRETGLHQNNRAENSNQPFRRREPAMLQFRRKRSLQKFARAHSSVYNQFASRRFELISKGIFAPAPASRPIETLHTPSGGNSLRPDTEA